MKKTKLFLLLLIYCTTLGAQKEAAQWRFGKWAGLDFQNGSPAVVNSNIALSFATSSGISDANGNLLFYVRGGDMIINKNNDTMANGTNIGGGPGFYASIVVPKNQTNYYVLCSNALNYFQNPIPPMLVYAEVDMTLANGQGSVVAVNVPISSPGLPLVNKFTVTKHCNGQDYWVLAHRGGFPGSNQFYAYLITSVGISTVPVISAVGNNQTQTYAPASQAEYWQHKFSPNGKKLCGLYPNRTVELYDFDNATGIVSNPIKIDSTAIQTYTYLSQTYTYSWYDPRACSVEFSPDASKLYVGYACDLTYVTKHAALCQFDLLAGNPAAIAMSKTIIFADTITLPSYPGLQSAIDGKVYVGTDTYSISVIHNPNLLGTACNFQKHAVALGTAPNSTILATCSNHLPSFISNYFEKKPTIPAITGTMNCGTATFTAPVLEAAAGYSVSSVNWNFGDALSGTLNTSNSNTPTHIFSANGTYTVKLFLQYLPCGIDTLTQVVNISGLPTLSVSGKTSICVGNTSTFSFSGANTFSLNSLSLSQPTVALQPTTTSVYTLTGKDNASACESKLSISLAVSKCTGINELNLGDDEYHIYPNPFKDKLTIFSRQTMQVEIFDLSGRHLKSYEIKEGTNELRMDELKAGLYFLKLTTDRDQRTLKIIKE